LSKGFALREYSRTLSADLRPIARQPSSLSSQIHFYPTRSFLAKPAETAQDYLTSQRHGLRHFGGRTAFCGTREIRSRTMRRSEAEHHGLLQPKAKQTRLERTERRRISRAARGTCLTKAMPAIPARDRPNGAFPLLMAISLRVSGGVSIKSIPRLTRAIFLKTWRLIGT